MAKKSKQKSRRYKKYIKKQIKKLLQIKDSEQLNVKNIFNNKISKVNIHSFEEYYTGIK